MKRLFILLLILIFISLGCTVDNSDNTDCCKTHGGVAMCYRPTGASHGHIMCKDGYTCQKECY